MGINYLKTGALLGLFAVAFGAFGAHALKNIVEANKIGIFETGVRYQFYHSFALLAVGLVMLHLSNKHLRLSAKLFIAGTFCFSGSLYFLALRDVLGIGSFAQILGPITPIGGLLLMLGWLFFFIGIGKRD